MKTVLITLALIGFGAAALLPDSATQGPNPQDIATPEPEYIDIDLPEPPRPAAPAPAVQSRSFVAAPRPVQRPVASYLPPQRNYQPAPAPIPQVVPGHAHSHQAYHPAPAPQVVPGHTYSQQSGYQYRRPVYIRRVYRRRY